MPELYAFSIIHFGHVAVRNIQMDFAFYDTSLMNKNLFFHPFKLLLPSRIVPKIFMRYQSAHNERERERGGGGGEKKRKREILLEIVVT